jgi:hypothetical protein
MKLKLNNKGLGLLFFNRILLSFFLGIVYFLILTPIGLLLRIFGKDLLKIKFSKKKNSNWIKKEKNLSSMDKQF